MKRKVPVKCAECLYFDTKRQVCQNRESPYCPTAEREVLVIEIYRKGNIGVEVLEDVVFVSLSTTHITIYDYNFGQFRYSIDEIIKWQIRTED